MNSQDDSGTPPGNRRHRRSGGDWDSQPLREAVVFWLEAALDQFLREASGLSGVLNPSSASPPTTPRSEVPLLFRSASDIEPLALPAQKAMLEAWRSLPSDHGFRHRWELSEYLLYLLQASLLECQGVGGFDVGRTADSIVLSLLEPPRVRQFSVRLATRSRIGISFGIGGAHDLAVASTEDEEGYFSVDLSGALPARTGVGAVAAIEEIVETLLGALTAAQFIEQWPRLGVPLLQHVCKVDGEDFPVSPRTADMLARLFPTLPDDLSELESHRMGDGDHAKAVERHARLVITAMTSAGPRGEQARNACRIAISALNAHRPGVAAILAFAVIEGLLLDPGTPTESVGRLTEAVAHSLGDSHSERAVLRRTAKRLYDLRSVFVHRGHEQLDDETLTEILDLMMRVLRKELGLLRAP